MTATHILLSDMLKTVAHALGEDLRQKTVFVGGCTTGLFLTDDFAKEEVRYTDDVDLIIDIIGYAEWAELQSKLRAKGFTESIEDDVICRMRLGALKVDFMPDDETILGFTNRWYRNGLISAVNYNLGENLIIRVLTPPLFIATKMEAWLGRGGNDPLGSHDLEDILILIDGRKEIVSEIRGADKEIKHYIAEETDKLLSNPNFGFAVQGNFRTNTGSDTGRADLVFERLEAIRAMKDG